MTKVQNYNRYGAQFQSGIQRRVQRRMKQQWFSLSIVHLQDLKIELALLKVEVEVKEMELHLYNDGSSSFP